jgi:response regulator RpfG family c-di-GMP phosphodiesterase
MSIRSLGPDSDRRAGQSLFGSTTTLVLTAAITAALAGLPLIDQHAPVFPLLLFMLPLGLCAIRFGARGGLAAAALGTLVATVWFLRDDQHFANGAHELLARMAVFTLVGGMIGTAIDGRRRLEREYHSRMEQAVRERTTALEQRTAELEQRTVDLEDSRLETLQRLALAAEYRDDDTFQHTERVGRTALLLAEALGLPEQEAELIHLAAPLHDVGKLGVPDHILLKPGFLTTIEFARMTQHTSDGACILANSNSDVLQLAEQIALNHHEWWNGSGYPHGLEAEQIPLAARIVALADVFDALTHARPYKHAWPLDQATAEVHRLRGQQFDPAIVDAFDQLDPDRLTNHFNGARSAELPRSAARPSAGFWREPANRQAEAARLNRRAARLLRRTSTPPQGAGSPRG